MGAEQLPEREIPEELLKIDQFIKSLKPLTKNENKKSEPFYLETFKFYVDLLDN